MLKQGGRENNSRVDFAERRTHKKQTEGSGVEKRINPEFFIRKIFTAIRGKVTKEKFTKPMEMNKDNYTLWTQEQAMPQQALVASLRRTINQRVLSKKHTTPAYTLQEVVTEFLIEAQAKKDKEKTDFYGDVSFIWLAMNHQQYPKSVRNVYRELRRMYPGNRSTVVPKRERDFPWPNPSL